MARVYGCPFSRTCARRYQQEGGQAACATAHLGGRDLEVPAKAAHRESCGKLYRSTAESLVDQENNVACHATEGRPTLPSSVAPLSRRQASAFSSVDLPAPLGPVAGSGMGGST